MAEALTNQAPVEAGTLYPGTFVRTKDGGQFTSGPLAESRPDYAQDPSVELFSTYPDYPLTTEAQGLAQWEEMTPERNFDMLLWASEGTSYAPHQGHVAYMHAGEPRILDNEHGVRLTDGVYSPDLFPGAICDGLAQWEAPRWLQFERLAERFAAVRDPETRESGGARIGAVAMGAAAILGLLLHTGNSFAMDQKHSYVNGTITKIEPIDWACRAIVDANLDGNGRTKLTFDGHQLPGTGYQANLQGVAQMITCIKGAKAVDIATQGDKQIVTVDLSAITFKTNYVEERTRVTEDDPTISAIGMGLESIVHGLSFGLLDKVTGADKVDDAQAAIEQAVRVGGVKTMETKCADAGETMIENAITKSYKDEAKEKGIDPANEEVKFVGKHPNWVKLYKQNHPAPVNSDGKTDFVPYETINDMTCSLSPALQKAEDGLTTPGVGNAQ